MASYSDQELRYARPFAAALIEREEFREWVFQSTPYEAHLSGARPLGTEQARLRSAGMKNPYWFNYWCGLDSRCRCRVGKGIETDILLVFACANRLRLALHVEVKRPGERLS